MASKKSRVILLTGVPGVGKTTLIQKVCDMLKKKAVNVQGFYTQEVRERGQRTGFSVITLNGEVAPLATIQSDDLPRGRQYTVGKYNVCLQSFENTALPTLQVKEEKCGKVIVIDEIGKMELFSESFIRAVRKVMDSKDLTVIATIPVPKGKPLHLVEEIRARPDSQIFTVSKDNRDRLVTEVADSVMFSLKDDT